jgi:choline kinase
MLMAKDEIDGSFAVINADDWYGPAAYNHVMKYFDKEI